VVARQDPGWVSDDTPDVAPALRVRGVHKRFGRLEVLRGVNFDLRPGEIFALVGENGAGKSTVVQCIARTYPADKGIVELAGRPLASDPLGARDQGVAVVWQDLALCDNLSVIANLFLGGERRGGLFLDDGRMTAEAQDLFRRLHLPLSDLQRPVGSLSGGQRQLVAIARAVRRDPAVLVLDEPTASLGVSETQVVERLLAKLRSAGTAILLVSHRLEQVFGLADRIAVLRDGRIFTEVSPLEVHPDDVVAMMSGIETDSTARRQLRRLRSLVEQLADVEPAASLPLIVSAMAEALGCSQLCVHLLEQGDDAPPRLRRSAAVGLGSALMAAVESLPVNRQGGPPGMAAVSGEAVVVDDVRRHPLWLPLWRTLGETRSSWSVPIVGSGGVLGTISGYADTVGRPQADQLELVWLYASHAAGAIERDRLLADATRRNRILETLRGVLDTLAGPQPNKGGFSVALLALCRGLGADAISLHQPDGECSQLTTTQLDPKAVSLSTWRQRAAAEAVLASASRLDRAGPVGQDVLAVPITTPDGRAVVTAWWSDISKPSDDALDLLDDAARSLRLALEREAFERANAEAEALRRSHRLQRDFLSRLNHELRTPLTAIQGYASTLQQPDVTWDVWSQNRFLDSIASESARMGRLVGDLLDFSAIDSGTLRLVPDWCDLGLVLEAARRCVSQAPPSLVELGDFTDLPAIWGDHDRLEQVFVNLIDNAVSHASGLTWVKVSAAVDANGGTVTVRVADDGCGLPAALADRVFLPHERGTTASAGAGLGLAIARGIVDAHGGSIGIAPGGKGTSVIVKLPVEPADAGVEIGRVSTVD
jgi:signal transduction histidine kinase/ABC-type multidrug transport system ATPase subunit